MRLQKVLAGIGIIFFSLFIASKFENWLTPDNTTPSDTTKSPRTTPFAVGKAGGSIPWELQTVKTSGEGTSVTAFAIITFDIKHEEVRAVAIDVVKELRRRFPAAQNIHINMQPWVDCPVYRIAELSYQKGKVVINFGIPDGEQIEAWNRRIGRDSSKGNGIPQKVIEIPRIYRPDRETFARGLAVTRAIAAARTEHPDMSVEGLLETASRESGMSYAVVKRYWDYMNAYYQGTGFSTETVEGL